MGEHSCEVILNLDKWFRRRCSLKTKLTDNTRQTMDAGRRQITKAHVEPSAQAR